METTESQYDAAVMDRTCTDDMIEMFKATRISDPNDPEQETELIDWEKERDETDRIFNHQSIEKLKQLPRYVKPKGLKSTTVLKPHQQDGVRWLVSQEKTPKPTPFQRQRTLKDGTVAFYDVVTGCRLQEPYPPIKGSILADEMGLGKTVQGAALILSNPPPPPVEGTAQGPVCTLVLCPKSVILTWKAEIEKFVKPGALRVLVFEGTPNQRSKIMGKVHGNEVDLLLATYDRVGRDYGEPRQTNGWGHPLLNLYDASFYRIILDEAQEIRNPRAKKSKGAIDIAKKSRYRVAMTGTPLINSPADVQALLCFVGLSPWEDTSVFNRFIANPIKNRKRAGLKKLRLAFTFVCLRRNKDVLKGLSLVPKHIELVRVSFPERSYHKKVHEYWLAKTIEAYRMSEVDKTRDAAQKKFAMQLKLRQSCASGALVEPEEMQVESEFPVMAPKTHALRQGIKKMESDEKAIVFSQFISFLDIIERDLTDEGHSCVRIDGSMNLEARFTAMQALEDDPHVRFILCSLKAGGCGINLTRANVVFMMDPWWNDATEMQAVDRCHRLGQTREVRVYRFVMKNSIEEKMVTSIQEAKAKLGKGAMAHLTAEELKMAKIMTLKDFFGITEATAADEIDKDDDDDDDLEWE